MIGSLRGILAWRTGDEVCVEVGGVGYRVTVMPTTSVSLGEAGAEVYLQIHHHVREDASVLYGFGAIDERVTFEVLIGTHGVGPALAMAILGVHPPTALARVLADDDIDALCLVPGVGRKTGARLLVELKNRLDVGDPATAAIAGGSYAMTADGGVASARGDVRDALLSLGYQPDEVAAIVRELPDVNDSGELLRTALQKLAVT
jgi:Holliday junction DNA helicase RuvA